MLDGATKLRADLRAIDGKRLLEAFISDYCVAELKGAPRVLEAAGDFRFTDSSRSGFVSLLNLASVEELSRHAGNLLDPLRFRANIHVRNLAPWREAAIIGQTIAIGDVRLKVLKTIDRCPATHVDPETGERDVDVMEALRRAYGHIECGIYTKVVAGGVIASGDEIILQS